MFSLPTDITVFALLCLFFVLAFLPESAFSYLEYTSVALDISHFPAFWCLQIVLHSSLKRLSAIPAKYNLVIVTSSSFGVAVLLEQIQPYFNRSQNLEDLILGILGFTYAAIQFAQREKIFQTSSTIASHLLIILITTIVIFPKIYLLNLRLNATPLLGDFENHFETQLWRNLNHIKTPPLRRVQSSQVHGQYALTGKALDYPWSGISFENREGFDISNYQRFKLDFFSKNRPTVLHLRLDDIYGNKANTDTQIADISWSHVSFDLTTKEIQRLDTANITNVSLFYETENGPNTYQVDYLRLE
ncbi:MAG: hypothetical protein JKY67_20685 [Pseudomonadales bacterium]|nr:hypothetical protein [Pseudomonadales bacterium]